MKCGGVMKNLNVGNIEAYSNVNKVEKVEKVENDFKVKKISENENLGSNETTFYKDISDQSEASKYKYSLNNKLKNGGVLTHSETEYLKVNAPELYKESTEINKERRNYENSLSKASSVEQVQKVKQNALDKFSAEIKSIENDTTTPDNKKMESIEKVEKKLSSVISAHTEFEKSNKFIEISSNDNNKQSEAVENLKSFNKADEKSIKEEIAVLKDSIEKPISTQQYPFDVKA